MLFVILLGVGDKNFVVEIPDAERRVIELDFFFVLRMGRVIGSDRVDHAVENAFDHRVAVGGRAQGRIHLGVRVVVSDVLLGEQKMMRRDLAGHAQAIAPRLAYGGESRGG